MQKRIYDYTDYREFLRDWLDEKKSENSMWSHRMVASKVGLKSGGHISQILAGKAKLKSATLDKFCQLIKLDDFEKGYFKSLVEYNDASADKREEAYQRLLACQDVDTRVLNHDEMDYFNTWYYSAVRELLEIVDYTGNDSQSLGHMLIPALSGAQVDEAIEYLSSNSLIQKNQEGFWKSTDKILSTGENKGRNTFNDHLKNLLNLAIGALKRVPIGRKYNSWVTMSISHKSFELIVEELRKTRKRILKIIEEDKKPENVYHLNLNIFPVSRTGKEKRTLR